MPGMYDAIVIGGGPAGCATALQLVRRGRSVLLLEAERYPVHKLCGEFLSPESQGLCRELGVHQALLSRGAVPIRRLALVSQSGTRWDEALPGEALGLSRRAFDDLLFAAAAEAGAMALQGARVAAVDGDPAAGYVVTFERDGELARASGRVVVGAFGKRSRLEPALGRPLERQGVDFVAFKGHYVDPAGDLDGLVELHAFPGGYCGMSPVEGGLVNMCLIVRTRVFQEAGRTYAGLRQMMRRGPALRARLDALIPTVERRLAISQISFADKALCPRGVLMVGDSAALLSPLCGDGMSMALRGAAILSPLVDEYLLGARSHRSLRRRYALGFRGRFLLRLRLGRLLQEALFSPPVLDLGLLAVKAVPALGKALIRATREE